MSQLPTEPLGKPTHLPERFYWATPAPPGTSPLLNPPTNPPQKGKVGDQGSVSFGATVTADNLTLAPRATKIADYQFTKSVVILSVVLSASFQSNIGTDLMSMIVATENQPFLSIFQNSKSIVECVSYLALPSFRSGLSFTPDHMDENGVAPIIQSGGFLSLYATGNPAASPIKMTGVVTVRYQLI